MRKSNLILLSLVTALAAVVLFSSACAQEANFLVKEVKRFDKTRFRKIVVMPLLPVKQVPDGEFLAAEKAFADFVVRFFEGEGREVVTPAVIRREMRLNLFDADYNPARIVERYRPDGIVYCVFRDLKRTFGPGWFQGYMTVTVADGSGQTILDCVGNVWAETGAYDPPGFDFFVALGAQRLEAKLRQDFEGGTSDAAAAREPVTVADAKGVFTLKAGDAKINSSFYLKYHDDGLSPRGYLNPWFDTNEEMVWRINVAESRKLDVFVRLSCLRDNAGSEIELAVGNQRLGFTVPATAGWDDYKDVPAGSVNPSPGEYRVTLKLKKRAIEGWAANVKAVTLR